MPELRGTRFSLFFACLFALVGAVGCDEEPEIHSSDQPATQGGVQFEIDEYHIRYFELTDNGETVEYPDPVLAIGVEITNTGEDEFVYNPTHNTHEMSEARTPLLFPSPNTPEIDWETFTPQHISAVQLERGSWDQQLQGSATLAPNESVTDYFLFALPEPTQSNLILSIPPAMHRGDIPLFIQFSYVASDPKGPAVHSIGDAIDFDDVTFTVTNIEQAYIELEDSSEGEGFSNEAVLRISYTIENNSDEAIRFDPAHGDLSGNEGAFVQSQSTSFNRVRFPANTEPVGQQRRVTIEPGETIEDFATFERPDQRAEAATFLLAAQHFDRSGRVRVSFSYAPSEVEKPEELQEDD